MQKKQSLYLTIAAIAGVMGPLYRTNACTGITVKSKDNAVIAARTMDWSREEVDNMYVVVPRGHMNRSLVPNGQKEGLRFTNRLGFVGMAVEQPDFVIDGTNEDGLSAALFYFPTYGKYVEYDPQYDDKTLADFQVVSWILARFSTIDQVKAAIGDVRIVNVDKRTSTVHWRIMEPSGRQVVLEIVDGVPRFYENDVGVLTNAPGFEWMRTNLNNYVNLVPGTVMPKKIMAALGEITLTPLGSGSGFHGIPGDMTPPSRFVRAAFFQSYSIQPETAFKAVLQAFHILNNFDVPLGIQFPVGGAPNNMPAATQWTIATDLGNRTIYYHTMYNRGLRVIDMKKIDFENVAFQSHPLDLDKTETLIPVQID